MPLRFVGENKPSVKKDKKSRDLLTVVKNAVDDAKGKVATWRNNQNKWHKLRMRIKKEKSFPFPECANIRMPTVETKMRKIKANLMNVIFGIRPIVQVIPSPSGNWDNAKKIEKFLDHLILDVMNFKQKALIAIDQELEKGFYVLKPHWKTDIQTRIEKMDVSDVTLKEALWLYDVNRTPKQIFDMLVKRFDVDLNDLVAADNIKVLDKAVDDITSGKTKLNMELQDVLYNFPDVALCDPSRLYVPPTSGYHPKTLSYAVHEFFLPLDTVKKNAEYKNWNQEAAERIASRSNLDPNLTDNTKDEREGIERLQETESLVKIWEYYGLYDINGDGEEEKCVVTLAPDFDQIFRVVPLPFYSGYYPFVKLYFELNDDRWFSHRGIPELIEDIVKEIDIQHMQKIDQQTIRNAPVYLGRTNVINPNTMQFVFGQILPTHSMQPLDDVIKDISSNNPNVEFSYKDEQMILESKIEELLGQVDFSLHSMINKRQPRTLGEVESQIQNAQTVFSLDIETARLCFEELFNWIWELWCQYGDDEYEFNYFGREAVRQGGQKFETIKLTKEELQGDYRITLRGNDQNTNPRIRLQKAGQIIQAMNNEVAVQMGVITPLNLANAYKRFLQELGQYDWEEMITVPNQQQMAQQQKQAMLQEQRANLMDMASKVFNELTDQEQAQILAKLGIMPDVDGRRLKKIQELSEKGE